MEKVYAWMKATPGRAETGELGGMEGFTWTIWKCSLNCGSHGNLKPTHMFNPREITGDEPLHFSQCLSESLGETWGAFLKGSLWVSQPPYMSAWLWLMGGDSKPYRGGETRVWNPSQIWTTCGWLSVAWLQNTWDFFFLRRKKRLVKASLYTLCI